MVGDVILSCFVGKNFNRSFSKLHLKAEKQTDYYKYRSFSKFDYFTNSSAWVRRDIFEQILMKFNRQMMQKDRTALLLLDNYQGHKCDFTKFKNIKVEFLEPNMTGYLQPEDAGFYQTIKERFKSKLRIYNATNDTMPSLAWRCNNIANIMTSMDKRLVQAFWKIPRLLQEDGSEQERTQVLASLAFREDPYHIEEQQASVRFLTETPNCESEIPDCESDSDVSDVSILEMEKTRF